MSGLLIAKHYTCLVQPTLYRESAVKESALNNCNTIARHPETNIRCLANIGCQPIKDVHTLIEKDMLLPQ